MSLIGTKAAASAQGFGEFLQAGSEPVYIESVFSTYLYTGNGSTQTITNGVDLAGKGGLVWLKARNQAYDNTLIDTARGNTNNLTSNSTSAQYSVSPGYITFGSSGFTLPNSGNIVNDTGLTMASWTFRKQPKFFDVVTYTGDGTYRQIAHSLGSVPGFIIVKRTDSTSNWQCYHRSLGNNQLIRLNFTDAAISSVGTSGAWGETDPTTTNFTVGSGTACNVNGATYVAYLFAHNAGGFGLTGTDNVISCGSFTTDGSGNATVNLGYEPQFFMFKSSSGASDWWIEDMMRGMPVTSSGVGQARLLANTAGAEQANTSLMSPTATGMSTAGVNFGANVTYIYIAIRRGPMKTPTSGTSVFAPYTYTGDGTSTRTFSIGLNPVDMVWQACRSSATYNYNTLTSRLQGTNGMTTAGTGAEFVSNQAYDVQTGIRATGFENTLNQSGQTFVMEGFRRAPGFMDEVCYSGDGASLNHNLGVVPELIIAKARGTTGSWRVTSSATTGVLYLDATDAKNGTDSFQTLTPCTATTMNLSGISQNTTNVAYLFASCPGVSKCTAFTGTGVLQTINCGFTSGARFVLIKRTDAAGDWYVWDSSRGLSSSNDPYLLLNSTAAEVTSTNWVDTTSTGFQVTAASGNNVNINGASYIALAIA